MPEIETIGDTAEPSEEPIVHEHSEIPRIYESI
jgi:hypothetical protein